MTMNAILREKRKSIGYTQEQIANYLGVTAPAVNKWEKGTTCPDLALLPALARLLKTDPNTLLGFHEGLSSQEIGHFFNEVGQEIQKNGLEQGFTLAIGKTQEYPNCAELLHSAAMFLDGAMAMSMSSLTEKQKQPYLVKTVALYERVAKCDDTMLANQAKHILTSKWIEQNQYENANGNAHRSDGTVGCWIFTLMPSHPPQGKLGGYRCADPDAAIVPSGTGV